MVPDVSCGLEETVRICFEMFRSSFAKHCRVAAKNLSLAPCTARPGSNRRPSLHHRCATVEYVERQQPQRPRKVGDGETRFDTESKAHMYIYRYIHSHTYSYTKLTLFFPFLCVRFTIMTSTD